MDQRTGKIYENPTEEAMRKVEMTPLKDPEYELVKNLPEEERPVILALHRYVKSRADAGRPNVGVHERVAFRLGFKAGREHTS